MPGYNWEKSVIVEFIAVGHAVKVIAVDPVTKTEVSIVGDPHASRDRLARTAVKKLRYVLEKKK